MKLIFQFKHIDIRYNPSLSVDPSMDFIIGIRFNDYPNVSWRGLKMYRKITKRLT